VRSSPSPSPSSSARPSPSRTNVTDSGGMCGVEGPRSKYHEEEEEGASADDGKGTFHTAHAPSKV